MSETIKSIYESFNNRLKNPFIGAIIIATLAYNWRLVLIFFSDKLNSEEKIVCIEEYYEQLPWFFWLLMIFSAFAYLVLSRFFTLMIEKYILNPLDKIRYDSAKEKTLAKNNLDNINQLETLAFESDKTIMQLNVELEEKNVEISVLNSSIKKEIEKRNTSDQDHERELEEFKRLEEDSLRAQRIILDKLGNNKLNVVDDDFGISKIINEHIVDYIYKTILKPHHLAILDEINVGYKRLKTHYSHSSNEERQVIEDLLVFGLIKSESVVIENIQEEKLEFSQLGKLLMERNNGFLKP